MGTGSWEIDTDGQFGVFTGEVKDVPSLSAPGFIKASADGKFADASSTFGGDLVLSVRTTTPEYEGFRVSIVPDSVSSPSYACAGGGSLPFSRGCFKSQQFDIPASSTDEFVEVRIPFNTFSDKWSPATGEQTTTCADDSDVCLELKDLTALKRLEVWAEGANGKVALDIKSIRASPTTAAAVEQVDLAAGDDCEKLYKIDGADCGEVCLSSTVAPFAVQFGGVTEGTCAAQGYTVFDHSESVSVGPFGDFNTDVYTKPAALAQARRALRGASQERASGFWSMRVQDE